MADIDELMLKKIKIDEIYENTVIEEETGLPIKRYWINI